MYYREGAEGDAVCHDGRRGGGERGPLLEPLVALALLLHALVADRPYDLLSVFIFMNFFKGFGVLRTFPNLGFYRMTFGALFDTDVKCCSFRICYSKAAKEQTNN